MTCTAETNRRNGGRSAEGSRLSWTQALPPGCGDTRSEWALRVCTGRGIVARAIFVGGLRRRPGLRAGRWSILGPQPFPHEEIPHGLDRCASRPGGDHRRRTRGADAAPLGVRPIPDQDRGRPRERRRLRCRRRPAYLGIPYAAPPVGPNRWKAPQPAAKWDGVKAATTFGARCVQARVFGDMVFRDEMSEDCLSLNVWTRRELADGEAAGDGVDLRRRLPGRLRVRAAAGRRAPRREGRRRRQLQLSPRRLRLPRASGADEGIAATRPPATTASSIRSRRCSGCRRTSRRSAAIRAT